MEMFKFSVSGVIFECYRKGDCMECSNTYYLSCFTRTDYGERKHLNPVTYLCLQKAKAYIAF